MIKWLLPTVAALSIGATSLSRKNIDEIVNSDLNPTTISSKSSSISVDYTSIVKIIDEHSILNSKMSKGFKAIALSNLAEGIVKYTIENPESKTESIGLLDKILQDVLFENVSPIKGDLFDTSNYKNHNLYLTHTNIILGCIELLTKNNKHSKLHKQITNHLVDKSLEHKTSTAISYQKQNLRWPADQTALLFSLYLYDRVNNSSISKKPIKKWLDYMSYKGTDPKTNLHVSGFSGNKKDKLPRGCALSWSVYYMSYFAPIEAKQLWTNFNEHFKEDYFFVAGFREWPKNVSYSSDADSGPIIYGIGVSATGFGLRAAYSMKDTKTRDKILNSYSILQNLAKPLGFNLSSINGVLGSSLLFNISKTKL